MSKRQRDNVEFKNLLSIHMGEVVDLTAPKAEPYQWAYEKKLCGTPLPDLYMRINLGASILHGAMAIVVLILSGINGDRDVATPYIPTYRTLLTWSPSGLTPRYSLDTSETLSFTWLVAAFSLLSAFFHAYIGLSSVLGRKFYFTNVFSRARNPHRWAEYALSSSLMLLAITSSLALVDRTQILLLIGLNIMVMLSGDVCEKICVVGKRSPGGKPLEWAVDSRLTRMAAHLYGWVGYIFIVFTVGLQFVSTVQDAADAGAAVPEFVIWIVVTQFICFSSFGFTQMVLVYRKDGASLYHYGELSYLILSLVAKTVLSLIVASQVLIFDSLQESLQA